LEALACARLRLPPEELAAYLTLLADPDKHQDYLAEMFPLLRVDPGIAADQEVSGRGAGNTTIDSVIGPAVKKRTDMPWGFRYPARRPSRRGSAYR
jgi:hypothetical protein